MAYMNQAKKSKIKAELKNVIPADWKWSLPVCNHSTIVLTVRSAPVDLLGMFNASMAPENRIDRKYAQVYSKGVLTAAKWKR